MSLSVVIVAKNAAKTIGQALESIQDLADEVIVVDMKSDDETVAIAKKFTKHIFHYPQDLGFADPARNFALSKASSDWIFVLDADEEVSAELKQALHAVATNQTTELGKADCYFVPRQNIIFGQPMQKTGWWPDYQLRLFKNGFAQWTDKVHTAPQTKGVVAYLPAQEKYAIIHHNYQSILQFIDRLNRYTSLQQKTSQTRNIQTKTAIGAFAQEFLRRCFADEGIDEGLHGVSLSLLQSFYELTVFLKDWEAQGFQKTTGDQPETIQALTDFQGQLQYWIADWHVKHTSGLSRLFWQIRRKVR